MNVMNVNRVLVARLHERSLKTKLQVRESPSRLTSFDLDLIIPEYKRPSGFFGVRANACIRQNTVFKKNKINPVKKCQKNISTQFEFLFDMDYFPFSIA